MSETMQNGFVVPDDQDFNTETFQGSMQQVLQDNIGSYVIVEFLIGTGQLTVKQGILYFVGSQFLVLWDELESRYVVCDIFAVKFVTFLTSGMQGSESDSAAASAPSHSFRTPGQAAYAHVARQNRR